MNTIISLVSISFFPMINIIFLFILGFGLTQLILPRQLKQYHLWLSPWTTIIVAIFSLVITSLFGLSVIQVAPLLITFFLLIDIFVLVKRKFSFSINKIEDLIILFFIIITIIFNLSPLIRRDRILTTISLGNNDVISYTTTADYLKNHSIAESFESKVEESTGVLLKDGYRWGTPIINSFFLVLLNLEGYQYTYTSQVVLFSLFLPLVYIFFKILFKPSIFGLIMANVLIGFNANLLYMLYHDFFGQVLFWGLEMLLFIFLYLYLHSSEIEEKKLNFYDYILGILVATLFFSYLEPAIFMFAPLGIFLILKLFILRKNISCYIEALIRIFFIAFITSSISIIRAIVLAFQQAFMGNPNQPIGWQLFRNKIPYANPFEAMGFWSIHNFEPMVTPLAIALSTIVVLIIAYGLIKSRYRLITISYFILFILFYFWTGISLKNFFAYNRAVTYTLPFIIIFFVIGLSVIFEKHKYLGLFLLIIFTGFTGFSAVKFNKRFIREHLVVDKSYISISELKNKKLTEPIYYEGFIEDQTPLWKQIWISYFLYSKDISKVPTVFDNSQYKNRVPDGSLVLISRPTSWIGSPSILFKNIVWSNNYYRLGRLCNSEACLLDSKESLEKVSMGENKYEDTLLISGWDINEGSSRWANEKESKLRLAVKDGYFSKIAIEAVALKNPQNLTVYMNDRIIGRISIGTDWKSYSLPVYTGISRGVYNIKFEYSYGYKPSDVIPGNLDNRILYVNFKKIAFE
ncbi:MAG: hypothetical protein WC741_04290 [Patescibacteria group bacterium]